VCAPANKSHPLGRGRAAADAERFSGFKNLREIIKRQEMQRSLQFTLLKGGDLSCALQKKSNRFVCGVFRVPVIRGVSGNSYTNIQTIIWGSAKKAQEILQEMQRSYPF
jgi:hypothetical protein